MGRQHSMEDQVQHVEIDEYCRSDLPRGLNITGIQCCIFTRDACQTPTFHASIPTQEPNLTMNFLAPPETSQSGTLHYIPPNLAAFEPTKPLARSANISTLIWIGGMYDTFLSVAYPLRLAQALPMTWSLMTVSLSSAGLSWGVGSIAKDAAEIAKIVAFVQARRPGGRVVLMGHSTGCQDCMEYVVGAGAGTRARVDGVVLQAPVSDREALEHELPAEYKRTTDELALAWCRERRGANVLPDRLTNAIFAAPVSARRWVDVSSPPPHHTGADDYFSSDLARERLQETFGKFPASTPLLILEGEKDEAIPPSVDKQKLIETWTSVVEAGGGRVDVTHSGVVPGASHNLNTQSDHIVQDLITRVVGFIEQLDQAR